MALDKPYPHIYRHGHPVSLLRIMNRENQKNSCSIASAKHKNARLTMNRTKLLHGSDAAIPIVNPNIL